MKSRDEYIRKAVRICGRASKSVEAYMENEPYIIHYMEQKSVSRIKTGGYEVTLENGRLKFEAYDPEEDQEMFDFMEVPEYQESLF